MKSILRPAFVLIGAVCAMSASVHADASAQEIGLGFTGVWTDHPDIERTYGFMSRIRIASWSLRYDYIRENEEKVADVCAVFSATCVPERADVTGTIHTLFLGRAFELHWQPRVQVLAIPEAGAAFIDVERESLESDLELSGSGYLAGVGAALEVRFRPLMTLPIQLMASARQRFVFPLGESRDALRPADDLARLTIWEIGIGYDPR